MPSFKDSKGKEWPLVIDYGEIRRVRKELGINLLEAIPQQGSKEEENPLIIKLTFDPVLLVDVVHSILRPVAEAQGIDAEQFGERLTVEGHPEMAAAFWEAYTNFFRKIGWSHTVSAIQEHLDVTQSLIKKSASTVRSAGDLMKEGMDKKMGTLLEEMKGELESDLA